MKHKRQLLQSELKKMGIVGGACLCLIMLNFVKDGEKKALAEISDCCRQGINWNLILMLAASFPVANALEKMRPALFLPC